MSTIMVQESYLLSSGGGSWEHTSGRG